MKGGGVWYSNSMFKTSLSLAVMLLIGCAGQHAPDRVMTYDFLKFYDGFRAQVEAQGLNPKLLDDAFSGNIAPDATVLDHEKAQPETTQTFSQYLAKMMNDTRRTKAVALYGEHRTALSSVEARTGVPSSVLVALWGIESNFGANMGKHPVIPALVTLAWRSPRGTFFGKEAMDALRVAAQQRMEPSELVGSWAGAMGQCQFMPSNYLKHATDGDGDGKADIWGTPSDVFASSAMFLKHLGWQKDIPWRLRATVTADLPDTVKLNERGLSEPYSVAQWQRWGIIPSGKPFSGFGGVDTLTRLYRPLGHDGPVYLLGPNYNAILGWNKSSYFATSVLLLSESIEKGGELPDV